MVDILNTRQFISEVKRAASNVSYKASLDRGIETRALRTESFINVTLTGWNAALGDFQALERFAQAGSDRFQEPVELLVGADMGDARGEDPSDSRFKGTGSTKTEVKGIYYSAFVEFPAGKGPERPALRPAFRFANQRLEEFLDEALGDPDKDIRWVMEMVAKQVVSQYKSLLRRQSAVDTGQLLESIGFKTLK